MALILRYTIPKALMIITSSTKSITHYPAIPKLELCENEPLIENIQTITKSKPLEYSTNDINKIVDKMKKEYKIECCNECGNC